jgi:hypothetical protein
MPVTTISADQTTFVNGRLVLKSQPELREAIDTEYCRALFKYFDLPLNPHQPPLTLTPTF